MDPNLNQTLTPLAPHSKDHESGRDFSRLVLSSISIEGGTQARAEINPDVVNEYAAAIKDGATFPLITIYYDGAEYWLADGFHRFHAMEKAGLADIDADVRQGTRRDAILHSVGANEEHGLRRTNNDKRRAVQTLLNDAEWSQWTDAAIAKAARVNRKLVSRLRNDCHLSSGTSEPTARKYINKHGAESVMETGNIGWTKPTRAVSRTIDPEFRADPDFQAEAEESARDDEMEREERLSIGGDLALAAENKRLRTEVDRLTRRIGEMTMDITELKNSKRLWRTRAIKAGWREARADA